MPIHLPPISRRGFLKGTLATAGALAVGPTWAWGKETRAIDPHRLALFSDIHLDADREFVHKTGIKMWDHFLKVRAEMLAMPTRPAALLVNGDLAHLKGRPEDYALVAEGLKEIRASEIPVHLAMGNHDERENFFKGLPADDRRVAALQDHVVSVVNLPHADWYMLDSLLETDKTPGKLGEHQLKWLGERLDEHSKKPAVIMVHHQPNERAEEKISGLKDTTALMDLIVPREQVKAVIFGHTHVWHHYEKHKIHFINLPMTAYLFNPDQPAGWVDAQIKPDAMTMQLHAIKADHPKNGEKLEMKWR